MSALEQPTPATLADLEALPRNVVGEIIFGTLHAQHRPGPRHARSSTRLASRMDSAFDEGRDGPGGWIILAEPQLNLDAHVLVPDVAGWRRERLPRLPEAAHFTLAPDWVCEILSPSTAKIDRTDKLQVYAQFGVNHLWFVDPIMRTLEVLALTDGKWLLAATFRDDAAVAAVPFEAHTFQLDILWADAD